MIQLKDTTGKFFYVRRSQVCYVSITQKEDDHIVMTLVFGGLRLPLSLYLDVTEPINQRAMYLLAQDCV